MNIHDGTTLTLLLGFAVIFVLIFLVIGLSTVYSLVKRPDEEEEKRD